MSPRPHAHRRAWNRSIRKDSSEFGKYLFCETKRAVATEILLGYTTKQQITKWVAINININIGNCNFFPGLYITGGSDQDTFTFSEYQCRVRFVAIARTVEFQWMNFDIAHRGSNSFSPAGVAVATKDFRNWQNLGLIVFSTLKLRH